MDLMIVNFISFVASTLCVVGQSVFRVLLRLLVMPSFFDLKSHFSGMKNAPSLGTIKKKAFVVSAREKAVNSKTSLQDHPFKSYNNNLEVDFV